MSELFLIAHKVRGEPALDIAEKMIVNEEEWWIIPTSGRRAYPYWHWEMAATQLDGGSLTLLEMVPPMPPDLPDHYRDDGSHRTIVTVKGDLEFINSLDLEDLGL